MADFEATDFDSVKISLASADQIRSWSHGEVKKPETINYRTLKPEKDGLFCEKIFGPAKDWECSCGKYKGIRFKGIVCERCGVEVTSAKVRRDRMGHIELAAPVSHIWYFKSPTSFPMSRMLDIKSKDLEKVLYFASYIITEVDYEAREADADDLREELAADLEEIDAECARQIESLKEQGNPENFDEFSDEEPLTPEEIASGIVDIEEECKDEKQLRTDAFNAFMKLSERDLISDEPLFREMTRYYSMYFKGGMGAEAVRDLLAAIDLPSEAEKLKAIIADEDSQKQKREKAVKRLEVVDAFLKGGNSPANMILDVIPVIPPDLRPMVQLDGGRFAASDLNDLYRRVINRNNRLKRLLDLDAPAIIVNNEKRMLQESVDALFDNGRRGRPVSGRGGRPLKSLAEALKGKQGRFRQNLLGKRVDYSGRSVIVTDPKLLLHQCGLPKTMALELFKPFVMKRLVELGKVENIKGAKRAIDRGATFVWDILEEVIDGRVVLLNRAPTLHRLSIQAFEPVLVEGKAIHLHPLVCSPFNADFDGDQLAIHVPLSAEAQAEARVLMLSANNLLRPQDGKPVTVPTQDMILGTYYLTYVRLGKEEKGAEQVFVTDAGDFDLPVNQLVDGDLVEAAVEKAENEKKRAPSYLPLHAYSSVDEAITAYADGCIGLHAPIRVRYGKEIDGVMQYRIITATVGRLIFNEPIPQDLGFVDRSDPAHLFDLEVSFLVGKKKLGVIIDKCIRRHGFTIATEMLDRVKALGYKYSTKGAITVSIADMAIPEKKYALIEEAEKQTVKIDRQYKRGFLTNDERYRLVVHQWEQTIKDVTGALQENLDRFNPIYMMADSGARGSMNQIRQLAGMRGLMADTNGRTIEIPIKANFREGLSALEYFISSRGARKGLTDTALRTADSGYLTRRLVDVSQEVIIRIPDCGTTHGIHLSEVVEKGQVIESFGSRIHGRFPVHDIVDPETGEVLIPNNRMMHEDDAKMLEAHGIHSVYARTVLGCRARSGVCAKCYGMNLATSELVNLGEAVGIIAAQSIGEPGTQLTMRTFHTGGVAGDDITQGLPRVEELFEARKPKKMAAIAEIDGVVEIDESHRSALRDITITADDGEVKLYQVPYSVGLKVEQGKRVRKGEPITDGALNPHDVLRISGVEAVQEYLTQGVLAVYRQQGVDINDKHIEVIIRQMMRKVRVEDPGDTTLLSGTVVDVYEFEDANAVVQARIDAGETDLRLATDSLILMGITKASLATESFLSAASFQETTKVLTEAAIKGKVDHLVGLKENVIIGKLIPAGSGLDIYRDFEPTNWPESSVTQSMIDNEQK